MSAISGAILCLAYILGLLLTGIPGSLRGMPIGAIVILLSGILAACLVPRFWRTGPKLRIWAIAGVVGFLATLYFHWRVPHPDATNISQQFLRHADSVQVEVRGQIATSPRLTQNQRIQFDLNAISTRLVADQTNNQIVAPSTNSNQPATPTNTTIVTGKVYVTVELLDGTGLRPGQVITVKGSLYKPKPATNPGGFDFAKFLAQRGIFAGLSGRQVEWSGNQVGRSPLWFVRQRIIRAQVQSLGVPEGALVSAMVMGSRSVDVPHTIRDQFRVAGLAHALAASGTQVSMLVGVILTLTQRLSAKLRVGVGLGALLLYVSLTGFEPSVMRAVVMGSIALLALIPERTVKPLGALLFAAVFLLVWNPLWIWDLGFQLSFLATLGLLVTVPVLNKWFDWMPSAIMPLFTVPIAAYIWTIPLQLHVFGVVSPYSILINILTSPLIAIISIGGMISAVAALVYPMAGSMLAWALYYPTHGFIKLAEWGSQLPGSSFAVGTINVMQLLALYGLVLLVWVWHRSHRHWWIAGLVGMGIIVIPVGYASLHLMRITVLATSGDPVVVIQDRGSTTLINSGTEADAKFTVIPFLQKQGINQIDWAIAPQPSRNDTGWQRIFGNLPVRSLHANFNDTESNPKPLSQLQSHWGTVEPLTMQRPVQLGTTTARLIHNAPTVLQLQVENQTWLFLSDLPPVNDQTTASANGLPSAQVLWWSGEAISEDFLRAIRPTVAIASSRSISPQTADWLQTHHVTTYLTGRDGAVQWLPQTGFQLTRNTSDDVDFMNF